MIGDQRVRFCGQCELKVYNLSAMTRTQAEDLIAGTEGRLCVRYYRRKDGSILTRDCPVGLARLRQRISSVRRAVAAALLGFFAGAAGNYAVNGFGSTLIEKQTLGVLAGIEVHHPPEQVLMGTMAAPVTGEIIRPNRRRRR